MIITYTVEDRLYVNMTNRCSNRCAFCVRDMQSGIGDAPSLWLEREPTESEVIDSLHTHALMDYRQIVFCGYGEPLYRLDEIVNVCRWLITQPIPPIRINTNGLADLIHGRPTAQDLAGLVDIMSISLNAPTPEEYDSLCHSAFGLSAQPAVLSYAKQCKKLGMRVILTAVDVIPPGRMETCRQIAGALGVDFRIRKAY